MPSGSGGGVAFREKFWPRRCGKYTLSETASSDGDGDGAATTLLPFDGRADHDV